MRITFNDIFGFCARCMESRTNERTNHQITQHQHNGSQTIQHLHSSGQQISNQHRGQQTNNLQLKNLQKNNLHTSCQQSSKLTSTDQKVNRVNVVNNCQQSNLNKNPNTLCTNNTRNDNKSTYSQRKINRQRTSRCYTSSNLHTCHLARKLIAFGLILIIVFVDFVEASYLCQRESQRCFYDSYYNTNYCCTADTYRRGAGKCLKKRGYYKTCEPHLKRMVLSNGGIVTNKCGCEAGLTCTRTSEVRRYWRRRRNGRKYKYRCLPAPTEAPERGEGSWYPYWKR